MALKRLTFAAALAAPLALAAPSALAADCDGLDRPVVFAGLDWDSASFLNEVAGAIMEEGYGCETESIPGSTLPLLNGMIRGDIDINIEVWVPNVKDAWDKAEADGDVALVGTAFPDAVQHWYIPRYLVEGPDAPAPDLKSVADLPKYAELFEDPEEPGMGRFYNCILGWGCEEQNTRKLQAYGLTETFTNFRPGTGGALTAAIESAILREKPIVFYYWAPTWVMGKIGDEVMILEEPAYDEATWDKMANTPIEEVDESMGATAFPVVEVEIGVNTEFMAEAPSLIEFLGKMQLDAAAISEALAYMQDETASAEEAAFWWLSNNEDKWTSWVPSDVAERVKSSLASG